MIHWCHGVLAERQRSPFVLVPGRSGHATRISPKPSSIQDTEGWVIFSIVQCVDSWNTESKCFYNRGAIDRRYPNNIRYPTGKITRRTRMAARGSEELY